MQRLQRGGTVFTEGIAAAAKASPKCSKAVAAPAGALETSGYGRRGTAGQCVGAGSAGGAAGAGAEAGGAGRKKIGRAHV